MKFKKLIITGIVILGLLGAINLPVNAASYPHNIQYQKDSDGKYDPVSNNGKGPALDIGNGKYGQLDRSQAEAWNAGHPGTKPDGTGHYHYGHHSSRPDLYLEPRHFSKHQHQNPNNKNKEVTATDTMSSQKARTLTILHMSLIWTGVVLIGALLIYYFLNQYRHQKFTPRQARPFTNRSRKKRPAALSNPPRTNYSPRSRYYKDNKKLSIMIIVLSWILPILITDYSVTVVYDLTGHLSIAGVCKTLIAFAFAISLFFISKYLFHRGYRINSLLLKIYSGFMFLYGLYLAYNVITFFYDVYKYNHLFK